MARLIFVAGAWGSGTTAVAGTLLHLGVNALGPHFQTNDDRTRNSYELVPFRNLILRYCDERNVSYDRTKQPGLVAELKHFKDRVEKGDFGNWNGNPEHVFFLKLPLASLCIPELVEVFDTKILAVIRSLDDIESSRLRRNWPERYGRIGAHVIYSRVFSDLISIQSNWLAISYNKLLNYPRETLETIVQYCKMDANEVSINSAISFLQPRN